MFALLSVFLKELKNNFNLKKFVFLTCECQRIPFQPMPSDVGGKNPELKKVGTTDYSLIMETKFQEKVENYFEQNRFCVQQGLTWHWFIGCTKFYKWECGF